MKYALHDYMARQLIDKDAPQTVPKVSFKTAFCGDLCKQLLNLPPTRWSATATRNAGVAKLTRFKVIFGTSRIFVELR